MTTAFRTPNGSAVVIEFPGSADRRPHQEKKPGVDHDAGFSLPPGVDRTVHPRVVGARLAEAFAGVAVAERGVAAAWARVRRLLRHPSLLRIVRAARARRDAATLSAAARAVRET